MNTPLTSTRAVIGALGGYKAVAKIFGLKPTAVHNWMTWRQFPPGTKDVLSEELMKRGLTAPPSLWRMHSRAASQATETISTVCR